MGAAYVAVDRCKGCAQCVWVCDNMAKHHAIKMEMIDQIGDQALTPNITYRGKNHQSGFSTPVAVLNSIISLLILYLM